MSQRRIQQNSISLNLDFQLWIRHAITTGYKYGHIFITDAKRVDPPLRRSALQVPRFSGVRRTRAKAQTLVLPWK